MNRIIKNCLTGSIGILTINNKFQYFEISDSCENCSYAISYKKNSMFAKFLCALEIAGISSGNEICYIVKSDSTLFAIGSATTNLWIHLDSFIVSGFSDIL